MRDWLVRAAEQSPSAAFIATPDETLSFASLESRVETAVGRLVAAGVGAGSRVGLVAGNNVETVTWFFAIPRLAAAVVPLSFRATASELNQRLRAIGATHLVGSSPAASLSWVPSGEVDQADRVPPGDDPDPGALHSILFTSGTTGIPKKVGITWGNWAAAAEASVATLGHGKGDGWLVALPLAHVSGLAPLVRSALAGGRVCLEPRFDPWRAVALIREGRASYISLVAVMLEQLLDADPGPYPSAAKLLLGGGVVPAQLLARAGTAGLSVFPTYGMTETTSQVATARQPGGRPLALVGTELRVVDDARRLLPPGEIGTIEVRGPTVSPGYLDAPARAADEWFSTGDLGCLDVAGGLEVLGRRDRLIITGGENVDPVEVEGVLLSHPSVRAVHVFGVSDPNWGQLVAARVEVDTPTTEKDLSRVLSSLAGYKHPRRIEIVQT